jgi:CheY-like chemotaxis protein
MKGIYTGETNYEILVVEDDDEVREVLLEDLQGLGYHITPAADGEDAWDIVRSGKPFDAILSDINMPRLDGMAFLKRLKENGYEIPLVFLSAYGEKERVLMALRNGAFDFLEKPYDFNLMVKSMERAVAIGRLTKQLASEMEVVTGENNADQRRLAESRKKIILLKEELRLARGKD